MAASHIDKLIELAHEDGSDQRRELLLEVAHLFFQTSGKRSRTADRLFDDVLQHLAATMQESALIDVAQRFAEGRGAPLGLLGIFDDRMIAQGVIGSDRAPGDANMNTAGFSDALAIMQGRSECAGASMKQVMRDAV